RVQMAFQVLVEPAGTGGNKRGSEYRVDQQHPLKGPLRAHVKTHQSGDQHHQCDSWLGELHEICGAGTSIGEAQLGYCHEGTLASSPAGLDGLDGFDGSADLAGIIVQARSVRRTEVPSTRAPVATCAVVISTALLLQTVLAP